MYDGNGNSIATLLLSFEDKLFWPEIKSGTSGFLHKISIKRQYAGKGLAEELIRYEAALCKEKGIQSIRLDCDAGRYSLRSFYERLGFSLVKEKGIGLYDVALYKMDL